jgi:hypothetical protein
MNKQTTFLGWIRTLCRKLLGKQQQEQTIRESLEAEAQGDWLRAVELLSQLQTDHPEPGQLRRLAYCLLRAGQWQRASAAYTEAASQEPADLYHAGFAWAKEGDFIACLRLWQQLDCSAPELIVQKEQLGGLLIHALHRRLDENPLGEEREVRSLLNELALDTLPGGIELLARCRRLYVARLWQEERLDEIALLAEEQDWLQPTILAIHAKAVCQRLAAAEAAVPLTEIRHCIDCWLTLLFHPLVGPKDAEQQHILLEFGLELVRKQAARQPDSSGAALLQQWQETLSVLQRLAQLAATQTSAPPLVYAPALALQAQVADSLLTVIKNNREAFANHEEWLAAGAAYSPVAKALLLIRDNQDDAALDALDALAEQGNDPFSAWGAAAVRTACGLHLLQRGQCWEAEQVLSEGPIHWSAELEKQQVAALNQEDDQEDSGRLTAYLGILALRPETAEPDEAICTALTNQVVRLRSTEEAHPRLLAAVIDKAVALNPADEFAQTISDQVHLDLELHALAEAFDQDCFAEAARRTVASHFPQIMERFFEYARQTASRLERGDYPDQEAAIFMLEELLTSVISVDATHGTVRRIRQVRDSFRHMKDV